MASQRNEPTGWIGWIMFASVMMMIAGSIAATFGLVAVLNSTWVGFHNQNHIELSVAAWGWIQIAFGTIVFFSGIGVLTGNLFARTVGVIAASLSLIANFFLVPLYPFWAITIMVVDVLVIWALTAHGGELRDLGQE